MKLLSSYLALFIAINCYAQQNDPLSQDFKDTAHIVSFTAMFDRNDLDKDEAAVIKGYVVFIGADQAKKLDGKKVRITGTAILKKTAKRVSGQTIPQEREGPYWYIESPQVKIIKQ